MKTLMILLLTCMAAQASNVQLYEHRPYSQEEVSPDWYDSFTGIQPQLGGYPSVDDLLPYDIFDELYAGFGLDETYENYNATYDILEEYGVKKRSVYRVYFRPDRTIATIERVTLEYMDSMGNRNPYVLWTAHYATNSVFFIFVPNCQMEWASKDAALIYSCIGDECTLRAAFKGFCPTLTMEIYEGPYSDLPLSIEINNENIGRQERYEELFAGQN